MILSRGALVMLAMGCLASPGIVYAQQPPPGHQEIGPLTPKRAHSGDMTVYLELEKGDRFYVRAESGTLEGSIVPPVGVLRVYDAQESLMKWRAWSTAADPKRFAEFLPANPTSGVAHEQEFVASDGGIYQVRLGGEGHFWAPFGNPPGSTVKVPALTVWSPPGRHWGINQGAGGHITTSWRKGLPGGQKGALYFLAPSHPVVNLGWTLTRTGAGAFELFPESGGTVVRFEAVGQAHALRLPAGNQGEIWRMEYDPKLEKAFEFSTQGTQLPLILTDDAEFARRLGASIERIESGPLQGYWVAHKAQKHLAQRVIPQLLKHVGEDALLAKALEDAVASEACQRPADLRDAMTAAGVISEALRHMQFSFESRHNLAPNPWVGIVSSDYAGSIWCQDDSWCPGRRCVQDACEYRSDARYACCATPKPEGGFEVGLDLSRDRWDTFTPRPLRFRHASFDYGASDTGYGFSPYSRLTQHVGAWLATTTHPCNPFGPQSPEAIHRAVLARAAISGIMDLMLIDEDERPLGVGTRDDGSLGFKLGGYGEIFTKSAEAFRRAFAQDRLDGGASLGEEGFELWSQMIRRISADRHLPARISQNHNQSADLLGPFGAAYAHDVQGIGRQAADLFVHRFVNEFERVAPYSPRFGEGWGGTDGTYAGRTHKAFAAFWMEVAGERSQCANPEGRRALFSSFHFFNHTVAPEPIVLDEAGELMRREGHGEMVGGFNWARRFPEAIQWRHSDAPSYAPDVAPLALWNRHDEVTKTLAQYHQDIQMSRIESFRTATYLGVGTARLTPTIALLSGLSPPPTRAQLAWPAEDLGTFERFGDELVAVRKAAYYASFYTSKADQTVGGYHERDLHIGGSLVNLWTPGFGTALVSANWSEETIHGLWMQEKTGLILREGRAYRDWAPEGKSEFQRLYGRPLDMTYDQDQRVIMEASRDRLKVSGRLGPLEYVREAVFHEDHLEMIVRLEHKGLAPVKTDGLWENLPVLHNAGPLDPRSHRKRVRTAMLDAAGEPLATGEVVGLTQALLRQDEPGFDQEGILLEFPKPVDVLWTPAISVAYIDQGGQKDYPNKEYKGQRTGSLRIKLPTSWPPGQVHELRYTLRPTQATSSPGMTPTLSAPDAEAQRLAACQEPDGGSSQMDASPGDEMGVTSGGQDMGAGTGDSDLGTTPQPPAPSSGSEGGCGCAGVGGKSAPTGAVLFWVGLLGLWIGRRRKG